MPRKRAVEARSPSGPGPGRVGRPGAVGVQHRESVLPEYRVHDGELVPPVKSLERYFRSGGTTVLQAAFEHSFFIHPDSVRVNTPLYPDRARLSREHYPGLDRGARAMWQGREVKLGDNAKAQQAWARYTGRRIERASGYGVRHVWGHPWDPDAFTAGWNLCYMPFWAGMLTERQHPHPELERAVRQAAWDLYFGDDPVCDPPEFVTDPGVDLDAMLGGQPILLLAGGSRLGARQRRASTAASSVRTAGVAECGETLQDIVRDLMQTVLEDFPEALDGEMIDLLADMGNVDVEGRSAFHAVLTDSHRLGAQIVLEVNGVPFPFDSEDVWALTWSRLALSMNKGQLELGTDEGEPDAHIVCRWTGRFTAAVVAILPTEEASGSVESEVIGYPEGALTTVQTNRYERDRRNRAAAIAIHGTACKGCGLEMGSRYGAIAAGFIQVHHVTPVSQLGAGYVIDPVHDLVPLCPNCHAITHRRNPPLTVGDIQLLLEQE